MIFLSLHFSAETAVKQKSHFPCLTSGFCVGVPLRYLPSETHGITDEKQGKKTWKDGIWSLQGHQGRPEETS